MVKVSLELIARDAINAVKKKDIIVVIDVLRFSSSVLTSFANGAKEVIPTKTLKEAYEIRKKYPSYILAGERRGLRPPGFDLGNSPLEFKESKVKGKTLVFTTTSGTQALTRTSSADWVFIGGFLNLKSISLKISEYARKYVAGISLLLSGRKGHFSLEDFLCAGAIICNLTLEEVELSDAAIASFLAYKQSKNKICETIMLGEHAKHLIDLGYENDVKFSCQTNLYNLVPAYRNNVIKLFD